MPELRINMETGMETEDLQRHAGQPASLKYQLRGLVRDSVVSNKN